MEPAIIFILSSIIGIFPFKKILARFFLYKDCFSKNYEAKTNYEVWGEMSFLLPIFDFFSAPLLYICLRCFNLELFMCVSAIIMIIIWRLNVLCQPFQGRGISLCLGIFFIMNPGLFKITSLFFVCLLILSRYQSIAGFTTGLAILPFSVSTGVFHGPMQILLILCSILLLTSYKKAAVSILFNTFPHLSRQDE